MVTFNAVPTGLRGVPQWVMDGGFVYDIMGTARPLEAEGNVAAANKGGLGERQARLAPLIRSSLPNPL
jgi:hypothetical protein